MLKTFFKNFILTLFVCIFVYFLCDLTVYTASLIKNNRFDFSKIFRMYQTRGIEFYDLEKTYSEEVLNLPVVAKPADCDENKPILILGCSYAFGAYLEHEQTFAYKLAEMLKRPVYNMSMPTTGFQYMYYQTQSGIFYKKVPKTDTVIWIIIDDHFRRMLGEGFFLWEDVSFLHYSLKNNDFVPDNYKNPFVKFFKTSYTCRLLKTFYNRIILNNDKQSDKITDEALLYFVKTRENLEKHWNNKINVIVFMYNPQNLSKKLMPKLESNGFYVVSTSDLVDIYIEDNSLMQVENWHPNEAAWDLLTPLFVQKLKEKNIL